MPFIKGQVGYWKGKKRPNMIGNSFRKGIPSWNKGLKGYQNGGTFRKGHKAYPVFGENNKKWLGDNVGYSGLHCWVRKNKRKKYKCSHCGTTKAKRYEWANISGEYKRDVSDFIELCCRCHYFFDRNHARRRRIHRIRRNGGRRRP